MQLYVNEGYFLTLMINKLAVEIVSNVDRGKNTSRTKLLLKLRTRLVNRWTEGKQVGSTKCFAYLVAKNMLENAPNLIITPAPDATPSNPIIA